MKVTLKEYVRYSNGLVSYRAQLEDKTYIEIELPRLLTEPTTINFEVLFLPWEIEEKPIN